MTKRWKTETGWSRHPELAKVFTSQVAAQTYSDENNLGALTTSLWNVNEIQFARLLVELEDVGVLDRAGLSKLAESLRLPDEKVLELLKRARTLMTTWTSITLPASMATLTSLSPK